MYVFHYLVHLTRSTAIRFLKQVYSLLWLSRVRPGRKVRVDFPIQARGRGVLTLSDGVRLFHDVFIFADGKIQLGDNVSIQAGTILKAGVGASLDIGTNTTIESSCSIQNRRSEWRIGNHVWISSDCMIFSREQENEGQFLIGDGSCISNGTLIDTCGDVMIGNEVAIGHNCTIYTHNHNYCDTTKAAWRGGVTIGSVSIHDGAWIGSNVTILPGVTIARRSVIAAGAMVTKDVPAESVFGGVPAQFIKSASSSGHQHGR